MTTILTQRKMKQPVTLNLYFAMAQHFLGIERFCNFKCTLKKLLFLTTILLSLWSQAQTVRVTIMAGGSANPDISQYVSSSSFIPTLLLTGNNGEFVMVRGTIERLAPTPFTITVGPLTDSLPVLLMPGMPMQLVSPSQKLSTFNHFRFSGLQIIGNIDPNSLMINPNQPDVPGNIRLPDGNYRVCFAVTDLNGKNLTDPASTCAMFTIACRPNDAVQITTTVPQASPGGLSPLIGQNIAAGMFPSTLQFRALDPVCKNSQVVVTGTLERLSPSPFTITTNQSYINQQVFTPGTVTPFTPAMQLNAFGNFNEANLAVTGIDISALRDPNNPSAIRLPDGNYRICYSARYINSNGTFGGDASAANRGCATFAICTVPASAPLFTQPVNSVNITSSNVAIITPSSPVVFTWTPPQSVCGPPRSGFNYDFEIREMLDNQTVTDVVNNPFVFRKTALLSTTFLLDTNLYRSVLQLGKRYAIRVRVYNASPLDSFGLENNGFSRIEAFQYGNSPDVVVRTAIPFTIQPPDFYYIPFGERKTEMWDEVYTAYQNSARRDTIIPIQEYIALNLIQNGIAYNPDAIELFLAFNPELTSLKQLKLSTRFRMPEFPMIPDEDLQQFSKQNAISQTPDTAETIRFRRSLDSLNRLLSSSIALDTASGWLLPLTAALNEYGKTVPDVNRVSMNLINNLMAELLYSLRQQREQGAWKKDNHLSNVAIDLQELMTNSPSSTSSLFPRQLRRHFPLQGFSSTMQLSLAGSLLVNVAHKNGKELPAEGSLLPLDVIVWRGATAPPARAVLNAPELRGAYRVFYSTTALYNHKNPAVNASAIPALASTAQVSLPKMAKFKFWTLNMINHKTTKAVDVETSDVFLLNDKKNLKDSKRLRIILKVD